MSLNARERRALSRMADEIMNTAPEVAALFLTFNKMESGAQILVRAEPPGAEPPCAEPPCGIMAMPPRRTVVMSRPTRPYRRALLIIASALISIGLIAMVVVLALTDHGTTSVDQNYLWWASTRKG
jgi:hypothetical protein